MPISPEKKKLYPPDWKQISLRIRRERALERCECTGECGSVHSLTDNPGGRCYAPNGRDVLRHAHKPELWVTPDDLDGLHERFGMVFGDYAETTIRIVLTVAHLDHDPTHNADSNLKAMCQRCHLRLDRHEHARNAAETRRKRKAHRDLFE